MEARDERGIEHRMDRFDVESGARLYEDMPSNMGTLSIGTNKLDEGDRLEEDFTATPDLAAGAISELFNAMRSKFGKIPAIRTIGPRNISRKCDL